MKETFSADDIQNLLVALRFSSEKHRNQRRKDPEASPYINHPIQVGETIWRVGKIYDIKTVMAGLLHDTVEDTQTTLQELKEHFGLEVANIVKEVTDDKSLSAAERKRLQIEHAPYISKRAKWVKLSDKICNIADITHNPPKNWSLNRQIAYLDWTEQVVNGLRGCSVELETYYDQVLKEGRYLLKTREKG
jgi:GTP diphosphokinase / guanosine-3',5'-bis(diphosphate) 3'-diphosphatase